MNFTNTDTQGIDTVIEKIKDNLYEALGLVWTGEIDAYGRVYKNVDSSNRVKPERYAGNGDYKEVFLNDKIAAAFFFLTNDRETTDDEMVFVSPTKIVFMVHLGRVYPSKTGREDELAHADVMDIVREHTYQNFEITGLQKGLRQVFQGLDISQMKYADIHPYHCFSVDIDLQYHLTKKCNFT